MKTRRETDSLGDVEVPENALYGAQTQRAIENFPVSGIPMPPAFIKALGLIKACAAEANEACGELEAPIAKAIRDAALPITEGEHYEQFPVDVFQTGSGTSSNMNANEVIARLASQQSGENIHPNDHVNLGQSSNDVIPTAIHVAARLEIEQQLKPALNTLMETLKHRASEADGVIKTGRTHLMDGMPVSFSQEMSGWRAQIAKAQTRINHCLPRLSQLAQGGSAVGTGVNVHPDFPALFAQTLSAKTGLAFQPNDNFFEALSCQDTAVELSGHLKTLAVALTKIANDLRWMNSGPLAGLAEIELEALQPGIILLPGKVNPVIPEAVAMAAAQVIGNDTTITVAGQSGNFQLNVMLPVIAYNLLQSIELLANSSKLLADKAIATLHIRNEHVEQHLTRNPILVTALNPLIGYAKAAEIAKKAYRENRPVIDVAEEMTDIDRGELARLLDPARLI
ncbi:MAG: class II fumarate hydratase [bacterium]